MHQIYVYKARRAFSFITEGITGAGKWNFIKIVLFILSKFYFIKMLLFY